MIGDYEPTWKIGEPGSKEVIDMNCRLLDTMFQRLAGRCNAPGCDWPLSALRERNFEVPEVGPVCATCWDIYNSMTMANRLLKSTMYFRNHHVNWKTERENKRKREGLGGLGGL